MKERPWSEGRRAALISARSSVRGCERCEGGSVIVVRGCEWAGPALFARHTPTMSGGATPSHLQRETGTPPATASQHVNTSTSFYSLD